MGESSQESHTVKVHWLDLGQKPDLLSSRQRQEAVGWPGSLAGWGVFVTEAAHECQEA